jgi:hypothetical protein
VGNWYKKLKKARARRPRRRKPDLSETQILAWADAHHQRTGTWPGCKDGLIADALGEKWTNVDAALRGGARGLPGGSSLPQLLERHRGYRNRSHLPPLTEEKILAWADARFRRTGAYPHCTQGAIPDAPGGTWENVDMDLREGVRGLQGGSSLPHLLHERRGVPLVMEPPPLTEEQIWV